jgi:hypothetical protein
MVHLSRLDAEASPGAAPRGPTKHALLSAEESAATARPLRCWNTAARAHLVGTIAECWRDWREAWGLDADAEGGAERGSTDEIRCESFVDARTNGPGPDMASWQPVGGAGAGLWWALASVPADGAGGRSPRTATAPSLVCRALFGELSAGDAFVMPRGASAEGSLTMAAEIATAAWEDWCSRLAVSSGAMQIVPGSDAAGPASEVTGPWSGALVITVPFRGQAVMLLLSGARVAQLVSSAPGVAQAAGTGPAGGLIPIEHALAHRTARVYAQLQGFELELGSLATLRVGDVLRTTHSVDTGLTVSVAVDREGGEVGCSGFLGKTGPWRALELLRHPLPGTEQPTSEHERRRSAE